MEWVDGSPKKYEYSSPFIIFDLRVLSSTYNVICTTNHQIQWIDTTQTTAPLALPASHATFPMFHLNTNHVKN